MAKHNDVLQTSEFSIAWTLWCQHRKEKKKTLTPTTITFQLKKLRKMGVQRAINAIEFSIQQGYTGLFEPDTGWKRSGLETKEYRKADYVSQAT